MQIDFVLAQGLTHIYTFIIFQKEFQCVPALFAQNSAFFADDVESLPPLFSFASLAF